ncbi:maleylacetoacetate isomerase [Bradyrhizobium sp. CCBAU 51627]|uniref:maleylacetoacetate isomerase n=1 Tax=Bradyrhizobium sp. CCBAU 51627 TaxID=1325088 RepID=UPI002304F494|nr:maleylacetoacetate isomerase [Bradyrhizobium sp. CCBAU 51627]MDA9433570.1 maleylacetoacetate isomerase [Bradyrhizobium sp. CCBAU 51627]
MTNRLDAVLYGYFRSTAAYRVRIALGLKGFDPVSRFVHLRKGEQSEPAYRTINPAGLVPYWIEGDLHLAQSLAIIEYLDEMHPQPPLLPKTPAGRAIAREISLVVCCDIHPIGNLRVLNRLTEMGVDETLRARWSQYWIEAGFEAIERRLEQLGAGPFSFGEEPTLADICIVPQIFNARRFGVDLSPYPRILAIETSASKMEAFARSEPGRQPDAE